MTPTRRPAPAQGPAGGAAAAPRPALRAVALPIEHGAWGFLLEPALLGLLLAWSPAGLALAFAALMTLLLQTPVSLLAADARRGKVYPRTRLARRVAAGYAAAWAIGLALAWQAAGELGWLWPAVFALPLAAVQLAYDARNRARELVPEAAGAVAMGALAAVIAVAAGWALGPALALWGLLALRAVPAIVYVRARLRLERGSTVSPGPTWALHGAALLVGVGVWLAGWLAWPVVVAYALLFARAAWGLSPWRRPVAAKVVGFGEIGFGVATVLLLAAAVVLAG
ncbi:MAG: YwiC-like family protein [Trueperaceae bacterium]|nr:YwiC-like family protein [Trueperaceae bacterium]